MKRLIITLISLLVIAISGFTQWELEEAIEFHQRDGLPNFFKKVNNNETLKVGFIGGSITNADGWRPKTVSLMKEFYQIQNVIDYSAAISGTNSKFGVFRIDEHLLSKYDFDLIFVEFAVNDKNDNPENIVRSMEGIVRKIWHKNPYTDICFVYTVSHKFLPDIENGKMNLSASVHESIAAHYGIPSIFWGVEANKQLKTGEVIWYDAISNYSTSKNDLGQYVFTLDNTHPTDFGHQVYADVLKKCFKQMDDNQSIYKHNIKSPVAENNYENSKILPLNDANNHGMAVIDEIGEKSYLNKFLKDDNWFLASDNPEAYYSFSFVGSEFGISEMRGPSSGKYMVEIDGDQRELNAFDPYCSYWRESFRFIKLAENTEHFVKIYPSPNQLSLSEKREILNPEKRKLELDENPSVFEINELIFSKILLDGDLAYYYIDSLQICDGDSIFWHGNYYSEGGQYYDKYISIDGHDSIHQLDLTVCPTYHAVNYESIDYGDSLLWEGKYYKSSGQYLEKYLTNCGCDSILELNLSIRDFTSGVENNSFAELKVYPNPTSDYISLIWSEVSKGNISITLTNISGEIFYNESLVLPGTEKSIDMSSYPPGMYFLSVRSVEVLLFSHTKIIKI